MAIQIRDANRSDLPRILEIERLAFPSPWTLASFERELTLPFSRVMVAIPYDDRPPRDDRALIVGFLSRWLIADECPVLNIAVHPGSRRLGIGGVLITGAISEAIINGAGVVTLEVRRT